MSSLTMRHQNLTLAFIPLRREQRRGHLSRVLRTTISRRRLKRIVRKLFHP